MCLVANTTRVGLQLIGSSMELFIFISYATHSYECILVGSHNCVEKVAQYLLHQGQ